MQVVLLLLLALGSAATSYSPHDNSRVHKARTVDLSRSLSHRHMAIAARQANQWDDADSVWTRGTGENEFAGFSNVGC